jgi:hypothetical protein
MVLKRCHCSLYLKILVPLPTRGYTLPGGVVEVSAGCHGDLGGSDQIMGNIERHVIAFPIFILARRSRRPIRSLRPVRFGSVRFSRQG